MDGFGLLWWPVIAGLGALAFLIAALVFVFWIWMIVDCAKRDFRKDVEKIVWIIIIVLAGWLGALIYFFVVKNSNTKGISKK